MDFSKISTGVGYILIAALAVALAFLNVRIHPMATFAIVVGFGVLYVALRSPFFLLMCFIVFFLGRGAEFIPILGRIGAGKYFALSAMAILVLSKLLNRDLTITRSRFNRWMLMFTAIILISSFRGTDPARSMEFFKDEFSKTVIIFFLILNIVTTERQVVTFHTCVIGVCVFLAGYGDLAQILGRDPLTGAVLVEGSRAGGVGAIDDPNDLAMLVLLSIPYSLVGVIESRGIRRFLFLLVFGITLAGVLSTQSRGGLLGLSVGFALVVNRYVKNKVVLVGLSAIFVVAMTVAAGISDRSVAADYDTGFDESSQGRIDAWNAGARMIVRNPIIGVGFVQFPFNYLEYAENPIIQRPLSAHNTYIQVVAELGIPGFIAFMMLVGISLKNAFLMGRGSHTDERLMVKVIKISALPSYAAFLFASIFLSSGYYGIMYIMFGFFGVCYNVFELDNMQTSS